MIFALAGAYDAGRSVIGGLLRPSVDSVRGAYQIPVQPIRDALRRKSRNEHAASGMSMSHTHHECELECRIVDPSSPAMVGRIGMRKPA